MIYEELKIQLDLNNPIDVLKSIGRKIKDNKWFVVCDKGDCHLFDNDGNDIDISKIKVLNGWLIPINIEKIIIPNSVKNIEYCTFAYNKSLTSITIPDSVKSISCDVFYECKNLKSLTFEGKTIDQVKSMKNYPFGIYDKSIIKCIN